MFDGLVVQITVDDPSREDVAALLDEHLRSMHELSPPESVHALDVNGLKTRGVTFWTCLLYTSPSPRD